EFDYRWPCFEKFRAAGVTFDRAYSVSPICTPARSSMATGLYPSRHGLIRNTDGVGNRSDFASGQQLYSHHLTTAGYRNAFVGKWHCGHQRLPVDYGIEGWSLPDYGKVYMSDAYQQYAEECGFGPARARIEHSVDRPEYEGTTQTLRHASAWHFMNGAGVLEGPPEAHEEQFVAHLASEKLKELAGGDQPWSLVASFWGPHQAYYPSEPFASMFDPASIPEYPTFNDDLAGRPLRHLLAKHHHHAGAMRWTDWSTWQQILARAYGQGLQTDAAIGSVLDTLDQTGQADDTLVIWCADHGDALASHGGLWDKASTMAEEVIRVPMALRWPKHLAAGTSTDRLVSNMDVTATMLDAAGLDVPDDMDSRSMLTRTQPTTDPTTDPETLFLEHHGHGEDILQRVAIAGPYKYVAALYDADELYHLDTDPYEQHNLINDPAHADVRNRLRQKLIDFIRTRHDWRAMRLATSLEHGFA
ncbi:MAG: sulfatase-like hydrolase/transferase, partial [Planctomycetota bacterium]